MNDHTTQPMVPPWVIVGCGRVGRALTYFAEDLDIHVRAAWDRDGPPDVPAQHRLSGGLDVLGQFIDGAAVFITVSDEAIASVAAALAPYCDDADVVVHCSGSLSSSVLRNAGIKAPVGSVHPLLSVADSREAAQRFPQVSWTVEGSRPAVWWARGWLSRVDVEAVEIDSDQKTLYHAAAVMSAGLVVGLMDAAFTVGEAAGIDRAHARRMLLPLVRSTIDNLEELPVNAALTGPAARGDLDVIEAHRKAIAALGDENLSAIYDALTARTLELGDAIKK